MEILSAEVLELYRFFSLPKPPLNEDLRKITVDDATIFGEDDLVDFLNHEITIEQLLARKLRPTDDN